MNLIDSHQHFWQYDPAEHIWMTDAMPGLKKDFMPEDLAPLLNQIGFDGCIAVQARQSIEETNWLLKLADENDFIKGVVGWVDLRSPIVDKVLSGYTTRSKLVGVRHVVHDESDDKFMLKQDFQNGIAALKEFDLNYDLLLFPKHLPFALKLVEKYSGQTFVLDHIAKPFISKKEFSPWREDLIELAKHPNVFCKISGMITEANWNQWKKDDFMPYLDIVTEAFDTSRIMIGSDWPVCTLSGSYSAAMNIVIDYSRQFSREIRDGILGGNCSKIYKLARANKV